MLKSFYLTILLISAPIIATIGQTLLKLGMRKVNKLNFTALSLLPKTIFQILLVPEVLLALPIYAIGLVIWLIVLTKVDLSYAYPFLSSSYLLIFLSSWLILGEEITSMRWIGLIFISIGLIFVGLSR